MTSPNSNIILSRVRLARNLKDCPFYIQDREKARDIVKKVNTALVKADTFNLYYMSNLSPLKLQEMKERYLISQNLIDNYENGAVLINQEESLSIMVHEEDVIREQCFLRGLRLKEGYEKLNKIDDELSKKLSFAYDERLGYLTACPTNLGTGLRASVMMFLPALTESGKIRNVIKRVKELGLTVRGVYGEGSKAEGYTYQISNEVTLGVTEEEIIDTITETAKEIAELEKRIQETFYQKRRLETLDRCKRAYGILTNSALLSYSEFLSLMASVKLGANLGFLKFKNVEALDDIIINARPMILCSEYGKELSPVERDIYRAEVVNMKLQKIKE
ncbi:MAG: ATP--guanido phosphotransferase [Clostridiales bacterium]|nr:ATP--guanido phosphotransferase [Clostridiales bacterium]